MKRHLLIYCSLFLFSYSSFSQTTVSGVISTNTTWTKANSPYNVTGNLLVNSGVTLTIDPGVEIRFDAGKYLKIEGEISAVGLANDSIIFTSSSSNKTKGSWDKIWLKGTTSIYAVNYDYTSGSIFRFCRFSYAQEGIRLDDATIQIKNCLFVNNTYGINFKKTTNTLLYKNIFTSNTDGTSTSAGTEDNGVGDFTYCKIVENTFENNDNTGFSFGGYRNNSNNHIIRKNVVKNNGGIGFNFSWGDVTTGFSNNIVEQNVVHNNRSTGIIICRDQNTVRKNIISQNGADGIGISGTYIYTGLTIENNIIVDNNNRGIDLSSNNNTIFRYNQIIKSGKKNLYAAIELPSGYIQAANNTISYNTISYSKYYDFNIHYGPNTISNNNFFGIKDYYFMRITNKSNFTVTATNNYWAGLSGSEISNRIYDRTNDFELGEINYTSPLGSPNNTAPISMPINVEKNISNGRVVLSWTNSSVSDFSGSKIYYGSYTGYSYSNVIDAGTASTYTLPAGVGIDEDIAVTNYDASADGTDDQFDGNESWYSPANKAPAQVTISAITPTERQIQLNWGAVANANKYIIYKSTDSSSFTQLTTTTSTSYTDQNLNTLQQRYYYKVSAFDSLDLSYTSYGLEGTASLIKGAKPTNKPTLSSIISYTDSIKLNFSYNSNLSGINAIKVYRTSATESRVVVATLTSTATTYTDNVTSDKQYTYDVTITNATDESDASTSSTGSAFSIPVLNTTFHNKFDFTASDTLKWRKNALATKYQFQIDTVSTFNSAALITTNPSDTFYTNTNLTKNKYLYWRVRSGDNNGYSTWSNYYTSQIAQTTAVIDSTVSLTGQIRIRFSKGNYLGVDSIYVYRKTSADARAIIARLGSGITTYTDDVNNGVYYTYDIVVKNTNDVSKASPVKTASAFSISSIISPSANQLDIKPDHVFKFSKPTLSTKYSVEYDTINTFNSGAYQIKNSTDTSFSFSSLIQNQNYFMRVKAGDDNGYSSWSDIFKFQTYVQEATIDTVIAGNKRNTLRFTLPSEKRISKIYILRDTSSNPTKVIDSTTSIITQYLDTISLALNVKYYYAVKLFNTDNIQSASSIIKFGIPFNIKPKATSIVSKTFDNVGDFNTVRTTYSASGSIDNDGKISNYSWYVNDSLVNSTDSILIYYYSQGTNNLKLVITDNDGAKDSSQTTVTLKSFDKKFKGGILGGITALNPNTIFTADSTFDATNGASIYKLDKSGNTVFSLVVSSKIYTTPSVSSDSSVFITSGTSLNGFNKAGAPLWSTIPLGGLSQVTPTVDSVLSRIYVGVSNKNFFGIDYKTGKVVWNVFCDAPINASAVISGDRKLVFVSEAGTLYGFDIRSDSALTVPKWKLSLGEIISKSAAVDAENNFYFGTKSGNLLKIKLNSNGVAEKVWSSSLTDPIESSPVIDSKGNLYIGTTKGKFHKLSSVDGKVIWTYESSGSIKSTPAITEYGTIIFATTDGYVVSLDTLKKVRWTHKESSSISSNLLYIENMTYVGTEAGNLVAIYDNPNTNTVNTSLSKISIPNESQSSLADVKTSFKHYFNLDLARQKNLSSFITTAKTEKPVWGTFQGDYRRTGSMSYECPAPAVVNVPDCKFGSDSIIISTSSMQNRYWVINDQVLKNIKDPIIKVSATDTYKIQSYNDIGCIVTAIDKKLINLGVIKEKPTISTNTGSYKFCIGDSLVMSSSITAKSYKWYFSGLEVTSSNSKTLTTNISGAYSIAVYDSLGCKAVSDISLVMATNPPTKPAITRTQSDLVSSNSTGNQWYLNNEKINGATSQIFKPLQSGNYKVKTILNGCESALSENYYYLTTAISNLSNDEFVKISPNPTNDYLRLVFTLRSLKTVELLIHDMSGNAVLVDRKATNGSIYHLDKFSSGNYVLVLRDKQGKVLYTQKIIKN